MDDWLPSGAACRVGMLLADCLLEPRRASLGTRETFADLGQTVAEVFGVGPLPHGTSFLHQVCL